MGERTKMKRSEMIEEITFLLDQFDDLYSKPQISEFILDKLEQEGMCMTKVESLCDDADLRVITYWDEEDE